MGDVREEVGEFLERKAEHRELLRELLEVDRDQPWEFGDVSTDPGTFGELVARGIVEKEGEGYRLSDQKEVKNGLAGKSKTQFGGSKSVLRGASSGDIAMLLSALFLVVVFRSYHFPAVFRKGDAVLLGNDPYAYRYLVEQIIRDSSGLLQIGVSSGFPESVANGEPLMVTALWWVSELLGGSPSAVGTVMALYPIVSAVLTALAVYAIVTRVVGDREVGVLAVILLAFIPGHIFRTALGFADHHAFDYPWLVFTALALVMLEGRIDLRNRWTWAVSGFLGLAVAGQVLAWESSPLLILPIIFYVLFRALTVEENPLIAMLPLLVGLGVGALVTLLVHVGLGWHDASTAYVPAMVAAVSTGIAVVAAVGRRLDISVKGVAAGEGGLLVGGFVLFRLLLTEQARFFDRRLAVLFRDSGIFEMMPLYAGDMGFVKGPFYFFGLMLFIALPFMAWTVYGMYRGRRRELLVPSVYAWYFLGLAMIQRRFTGELAPFVAIFTALALVWVAERFDLLDILRGGDDVEFRKVAPALGVIVLIAVTSFVPATQMVGSLVIQGDSHDAARWMDEYAVDEGWRYPDNYVFSHWGRNRMYNYFVNGESRTYAYAKNNYAKFVRSRDPGGWYERLQDKAGFVVTDKRSLNIGEGVPNDLVIFRLHDRFGSAGDGSPGVSHFRAVYSSPGGDVKVFTLVPGATITGTGPANMTTLLSTDVEIEGASFTYQRVVETDEEGRFSVTVPYPGSYDLGGGSVVVTERDVEDGVTLVTN